MDKITKKIGSITVEIDDKKAVIDNGNGYRVEFLEGYIAYMQLRMLAMDTSLAKTMDFAVQIFMTSCLLLESASFMKQYLSLIEEYINETQHYRESDEVEADILSNVKLEYYARKNMNDSELKN